MQAGCLGRFAADKADGYPDNISVGIDNTAGHARKQHSAGHHWPAL